MPGSIMRKIARSMSDIAADKTVPPKIRIMAAERAIDAMGKKKSEVPLGPASLEEETTSVFGGLDEK